MAKIAKACITYEIDVIPDEKDNDDNPFKDAAEVAIDYCKKYCPDGHNVALVDSVLHATVGQKPVLHMTFKMFKE